MKSIDIIQEHALKVVKSFGHGPRPYANITDENNALAEFGDATFPRAWLYPLTVISEFTPSKELKSSYTCLLDFIELAPLDTNTKEIAVVLDNMKKATDDFLVYLLADKRIEKVDKIRREPLYHHLDENGHGIALMLNITLYDDTICS